MKPPAWVLWVGVALVIGISYFSWKHHVAADAIRELLTANAQRRGDSLATEVKLDSIRFAKTDTVKLFHTITRIDTVLRTRIDSAIVLHTDTVKVTVRELVTIDSTIRACRETVSACATLANSRAARIKTLDSTIALLRSGQSSKIGTWLKLSGAGGVGYLIGRFAK